MTGKMIITLAMIACICSHHRTESIFTYKRLADFNKDLLKILQFTPRSQNSSGWNTNLNDLVDVAFSRLTLNTTGQCGPKPNIITEFKSSIYSNISMDFEPEHQIYRLFHRILAVAIHTYEHGPCCQYMHIEHCLHRAEDALQATPLTDIFTRLKSNYNARAIPQNIDAKERLEFEMESHANRLKCVDHRSISLTVKVDPRYMEERAIIPTVIVFYILKGYRFLGMDDVCPSAFIYSLFEHYSGRGDTIPEHGIQRIWHDLRDCVPRPQTHQHGSHSGGQAGSTNGHKRGVLDTAMVHYKRRAHMHPVLNVVHSTLQDKNSLDRDFPVQEDLASRQHSGGSHMWHKVEEISDFHRLLDIFIEKHEGGNIGVSTFLDMCPALLQQTLFPLWRRPHPANHLSPHRTTVNPPQTTFAHTTSSHHAVDANTGISHRTTDTDAAHSVSSTPVHSASVDSSDTEPNNVTTAEETARYKSYLYGSLSVFVISLCSLAGAVFMKLSQADLKIYLMGSMLALAVGCLVADAALHLLPEVVLNESDDEGEQLIPGYLLKLCAFLGSIYAFFVLELMLSIRHTHSHSLDTGHEISMQYSKEDNIIRETNLTLNNRQTKANNDQMSKTINMDHDNNSSSSTSSGGSPGASPVDLGMQVLEARCSHASDRISIHDAKSGIKALAWMIIIGDGIHNFADGLAIGAAFALTFTKGISTSITVLCHELPHELGDFAVLISTGMSMKRAMFLNFASSLTAFAGLYVGLALGVQEEASQWIFAVGAGMFLYVALTDLVPECKEYFKKKCTVKMFFGQNVGLLLGYATMLLLAIYEDKLEIKA